MIGIMRKIIHLSQMRLLKAQAKKYGGNAMFVNMNGWTKSMIVLWLRECAHGVEKSIVTNAEIIR